MFRINSQQPKIAAPTMTASSAQGRSAAPDQLQSLMASLEQAIARLTEQYGGSHRTGGGGGDRVELPTKARLPSPTPVRRAPTPPQGPVARPLPPDRGTPSTPPQKGPPPVFRWPLGGDHPGMAYGCSAEPPSKGPTGGTLMNER